MNNYYQLLDVPTNASLEQIKKAYRKKAKLYHPDVNKAEDAHEQFILINEAYEYLLQLKDIKYRQKHGSPNTVDLETFWRNWKEAERQKARERAQAYARMKYEAYIQSDIYKTTEVFSVILDTLVTAVIILLVIGMPWLLYRKYGVISFFICGAALLPTAPLWFRFLIRLANTETILPLLKFKNVPLKVKVIHFMIVTGFNLVIYFQVALNTLISLQWIHLTYGVAIVIGVFISLAITSRFRKLMVRLAYGPSVISFLFLINVLFTSSTETESYWYTSSASGHGVYVVLELEGGAYTAFRGLRFNLDYHTVKENSTVTYTFGEGLFGLRVAKDVTFTNEYPQNELRKSESD